MYRIVQEDATRYLPHDPTGRHYQHFVYNDQTTWNPITRSYVPTLVFSGTRAECEAFVERQTARRQSAALCG